MSESAIIMTALLILLAVIPAMIDSVKFGFDDAIAIVIIVVVFAIGMNVG